MIKEEWKFIEGFENYMVSNLGRVKSLNYRNTGKEEILSLKVKPDGHIQAPLYKNGKCHRKYVHVLMAIAFIPIPEMLNAIPIENLVVHHIDGSQTNNRVENLCWMTKEKHDKEHGVDKKKKYSHKIAQFTDNFPCELVKVWTSAREIERQTGYNHSNITRCCRGKYGFKTAYGYQWSYWED